MYQYVVDDQLGPWVAPRIGPIPGEYVIMAGPDGKVSGDIFQDGSPKIKSGAVVTLVLDLDKSLTNGRDVQVKLTTFNGNVFVSTAIVGQNIV